MNFIASKSSDYKFLLDDSTSEDGMNRSHEDNLVMTELITDQITQVTNAYQKSNYTFRLIKQSGTDGNYFLNLVVKEYKDTFYLYIVKYVPDTFWLSRHSITNDLGDFTGHIYYYSDQGIYVANVTMQNGSSTSSSYNPCPDDTDDGIEIPDDDDGTGGGGGDGCTLTIEWYQCQGSNSGTPHPPGDSGLPNACNTATGPQTGSGYNMIWSNCVGERSMNDHLRTPCGGDGSGGGGNTSCQPDPTNPCYIPYTLDENCDCVLAEAIESDEVAVITDKEDFLELMSDCNVLENLSNSPSFDQRMQELINNVNGNTEIGYWGRNDSNNNAVFDTNDRFQSQPNQMQLSPALPSQSIDSYIHNHSFTTSIDANGQTISHKPFATFSPADFYTLFLLFSNNLVTDPDNFVMVMSSPGQSINNPDDDTVYAVTINNPNDFTTFGALYLWDLDVAENFFSRVGLNPASATTMQEKKLAEILKDNNLGMTLYRGNRNDLSNWTRIKIKNNGDVQENNCN
jgi:hypothetical protein